VVEPKNLENFKIWSLPKYIIENVKDFESLYIIYWLEKRVNTEHVR